MGTPKPAIPTRPETALAVSRLPTSELPLLVTRFLDPVMRLPFDALASVGPIAIAIDASHMSFQFYDSGVYVERNCGNGDYDLDHAVLAVGYGSENGADYFLVKNPWGTSWGQKGYIKMARNRNNQCGVATECVYPTV